jgi:hypothetical protein
MKPCLECGLPTTASRCDAHDLNKNRTHSRTTAQRGYGYAHARARVELARTLPAPCIYCGHAIQPWQPWHAAHRIDRHPEFGYGVAHGLCNERAKRWSA